MKIIEPKTLQGMRDFLPEEMRKRQYVMDKMRSVFERFGYDAIETPALEYSDVLLGKYGEEGSKLLYRFEDNGGRDIALRYDQTVPFARLVAANYGTLPMPFKRYEINRVWRADRPGKGRYREFYQCDIDIIGTKSLLADVEIAKVVFAVYKELGFEKFRIKFNSRRMINEILSVLGVSKRDQEKVIVILDKFDKIGKKAILNELGGYMNEGKALELMNLILMNGGIEEKLARLKELEYKSVVELEEFVDLCKDFGVDMSYLDFDLSLARGLAYYTGIIYEVELEGFKGSLCGGGRYDDLAGLFCKEEFSGVGVAFGFDRTVLAMEEQGLLAELGLNSQVLITNFGDESLSYALSVLTDIQDAGVNGEIYFESAKLAKQVKYADRRKIPFVVLCGSDEIAKEELAVKLMSSGQQRSVPRSQIANYFASLIKSS